MERLQWVARLAHHPQTNPNAKRQRNFGKFQSALSSPVLANQRAMLITSKKKQATHAAKEGQGAGDELGFVSVTSLPPHGTDRFDVRSQ
ncbi:MAG TPA: hypothetical protein VIH40_08700 [Xanthobacteraceae bacterium]